MKLWQKLWIRLRRLVRFFVKVSKEAWKPATLTVLLLAFSLFFNTWNSSLKAINESLLTENEMLREKSAGLLKETLFRVDTLLPTVTRRWGDTNLVKLEYQRKILLQGSRVAFRFYHRTGVLCADLFKDNLIKVEFTNGMDGIATILSGYPAGDTRGLTSKTSFSMNLGRGRYDFTAMGRKYYLYCDRLHPDSLTIVTTIMALDPIYKPTLGL